MPDRKSSRPAPPMMLRRGALGSVLLVTLCVFALLTASAAAAATTRKAPSAQGGDPLALVALQQASLTATGGVAGDSFGYSVAIDGDTAVVGAYNATMVGTTAGDGAAYVFTRTGTTWTPQQTLTASDAAAGDQFGVSVAISGDTVLVGAGHATVGGNAGAGAAYVFTRTGTTWTQQQKLTASDAAAGDQFGHAVALDGDTALVGANFKLVGTYAHAGVAYVFTRTGTTWTPQQELTADDAAAMDMFGTSVALDGDTALVGAEFKLVGTYTHAGAAYVFTRSGAVWTQQQALTAGSDAAAGDLFGSSVALSGDTALVGAAKKTVNGSSIAGAAYVFTSSGTTWTQQAKLTASDAGANDQFGQAVALDGDTALVGAPGKTVGGSGGVGAAYVFTRSGTAWTQQWRMVASDGAASDSFGTSVALSEGTALAGAYKATTVSGTAGPGAAYVDLLKPAPAPTLKAKPTSVKVGKAVTLSGTVKHFIAGDKTVSICRKVNGKLSRIKQVTITKPGAFKCLFAPKKTGKWVLVATYKLSRTTFASKTVTLNVHK